MRAFFFFLYVLALNPLAQAQFVCVAPSENRFEAIGTHIPAMRGAAVADYGKFRIVIGGKMEDPALSDEAEVYACDMLIVDYAANKTYRLPLGNFPQGVADQFSGVNYCYTLDKDTLWLAGGYGYDLSEGYETTFPWMTFFSVKELIDSVLQKKNYYDLFQSVYDENLAVTEGKMIRIGEYFLVYDGREITPLKDEYTGRVTADEWIYKDQLRKFKLKKSEDSWGVAEFQVCHNAETFYKCMPAKWGNKSTLEF